MTFEAVASADTIWEGEVVSTTVSGVPVMIVRCEGRILAFEDRCAHRGIRVSGGRLSGHVLTCPGHEWCYDIRSGKGINPSSVALRGLETRLDGDVIWIDVGSRERKADL